MRTLSASPLFRLLLPLTRPYRSRLIVIIVLLMPLSAGMAVLIPYLTKIAIDGYIVPAAGNGAAAVAAIYYPLLGLVLLSLAVIIIGYLADAFYIAWLQRIGQSVIAQLRDQVYHHTLRLPRRYLDDHPIGSILTRVTSDIDALGEGLASGVLGLFMDSLKTLGYLVMMFVLDWRLTLLLLLIAPPLTLLILFFQRRVRGTFFRTRQSLSIATGYLQEVLNGIKTVQLYSAEKQVIEEYRVKNRAYYTAQNSANFYDALLFSLVEGITTLALALLVWYAAGSLLSGILTLGVLVAFIEYTQRLFIPVREFAQQIAVLQRAMGALDHINQIMLQNPDPAEAEITTATVAHPPRFETLCFKQVSFRYRAGEPQVLNQVSFTLRRGQTLAIVGPSGSGKSTLVRLLTRAYGGYEGSITINDEELATLSADQLTQRLAIVHQNVFLFRASIAFNIGLDRPGVDRARIEQVGRYVNADRFINGLAHGYDTVIADSTTLSAGQAQLISLARAVAEETDVIIFDEATSAIDSMTEALIQEALSRLYHDKTVIAIAHRLSTVRSADIILVMDAGRVVEQGNHAQLLEQGGLYAELVGELSAA